MTPGNPEDGPNETPDADDAPVDHDDPIVQRIVEQMASLDEQERAIRTESADSLRDWIVQTYELSMVRAQRIALIVQQALLNLGLG